MAGEYSRELSVKVFSGQCRLVRLGFRQGGPAGYGLRRQLIDEHRNPKAALARGEQKSLQTDRVILTPGPPDEIEIVRRLYRTFVVQRRTESELAAILNEEGVPSDTGKPWSRGTIHQILTNEKYIGNNVFNRVSNKLKAKRVVNPPDMWVRAEGAFEGIIELDFFEAAQRIIHDRTKRFTDEELLNRLRALFAEKGWLSGLIIDETEDMPSSSVIRRRFGSLVRAYRLVGYAPDRDFRYIETNRALRNLHPEVISEVVSAVQECGATIDRNPLNDLLRINGEFSASVVIVRCQETPAGGMRWKVRLDTGLRPDITIVVRMAAGNQLARDYYLLPWLDLGSACSVKLAPDNAAHLDAYRFDSLDGFVHLAHRAPLKAVA